jgi:hypothetical protein
MMEKNTELFWFCRSCAAEFDPDAADVQVVSQSQFKCLIIFDGLAHSLILVSWENITLRRELERFALAVTPINMAKRKIQNEISREARLGPWTGSDGSTETACGEVNDTADEFTDELAAVFDGESTDGESE